MRELDYPQGDEGADGWNMTSSDCVLRRASGKRSDGPPEEFQEAVAEQRKERTKGQSESAEAERQRQKGQQAQQQKKATARAAGKTGTSLAERMQ